VFVELEKPALAPNGLGEVFLAPSDMPFPGADTWTELGGGWGFPSNGSVHRCRDNVRVKNFFCAKPRSILKEKLENEPHESSSSFAGTS
jgi:hypothetical protein